MNKYDKYLQELLNEVSFLSILYINKNGELHRLFCPFIVKAIYDLPYISKNETVIVEKLAITTNLIDVFIINNKAYYIIYFDIII